MFSFIRSALALLILAAALPAHAALKVLATTSDWGALVNEIGGDQDRVFRLQYIYGIGAHGAHKY